MKYLMIVMLLCFIGCGTVPQDGINTTIPGINIHCIEGHTYYSQGQGLAPKLNDNGTPVKCGNKVK